MTDISPSSVPARLLASLYRWDEIEGWRLLEQHFDLIVGFAFIVVLAPDDEAIALLSEHLPRLLPEPGAIQRIQFDPAAGSASLAESLLAVAAAPSPAVRLFWIDADPAPAEQFEEREKIWAAALGTLNRYRNTLSSKLTATLALALPARLLPMLRRSAPDLWSIRSGLFRIEPPGASRAGMLRLPELEWRSALEHDDGDSGDPQITLAEANKLRGRPGREILLATLLLRAGKQARQRLEWATALASLQEAYTLQEAVGGDPELRWDIANDLALVLQDLAQFERAEFYLNRALQTAEQHFGPNHPHTATSLNNKARFLEITNKLTEAESLLRRALEIDQECFGTEHPIVAIRLNNLAHLLQNTNRLAEAEPLIRRALAIDKLYYGNEHPIVALRFSNLATMLQAKNQLAEAEPLFRRALAIDEVSYGNDHPAVARDLSNLATLLQETNRLSEAEPMIRRALVIDELTFGTVHPNVARDLNNIAALLHKTHRLSEAEPLLRRALTIDESSFGCEHPNVARDLNNIAMLLQDMNRLAEAEPLLRRALDIFVSSFGNDHPHTIAVRKNYERLLLERGQHRQSSLIE